RNSLDKKDLLWHLKSREPCCRKPSQGALVQHSTSAQHNSRSDILAESAMGNGEWDRLSHDWMCREHHIHFLGGNFFPTAINQLFQSTGNEQIAVGIHIPLIARAKPAMCEGMLVGYRIIVIALYDGRPAHDDLSHRACRQQGV